MSNKARLTVDMTQKDHSIIKMACAKLGLTMREFMLTAAFEKMEEIEDAWLAKQAKEVLARIEKGAEKTSSWSQVKKRVA